MKRRNKIVVGIILLIAILIIVLISPPKDNLESVTDGIKCLVEQRNADVCLQIYQPVCATVNVQCITTPCDPVKETFSNSCEACSNSFVSEYVEGEC